ncbi:TetR/AcrR family transcriptional regulator [Actinocorallia aurea]
MTVAKKPGASRTYRSPLRAEQAKRTRAAVIDAASACFVDAGYAATTMKDIAARAGVSVETVYGQGSKTSLFLAVVDRTLAGDDEPVPVIERPGMRAVLEAPDPRQALERLREYVEAGLAAALPVMHAFQRAAGADPEIAEAHTVYEERRFSDMTRIAEALAPGLRADVTVEDAADVLFGMFNFAFIQPFIVDRGWSDARWAAWIAETLDRLLLAP